MTDVPRDLDPDARFLLANERTVLAWVRTAITLQAAGIGVAQFVTRVDGRGAVGLAFVLLGCWCGAVGWWRYRAADRAIRHGGLPPRGIGPEVVALAVVALGALLAVSYAVAEVRG